MALEPKSQTKSLKPEVDFNIWFLWRWRDDENMAVIVKVEFKIARAPSLPGLGLWE